MTGEEIREGHDFSRATIGVLSPCYGLALLLSCNC
jgi:hypothetical protein